MHDSMPIIRVQLDHMAVSIENAMMAHSDEINERIRVLCKKHLQPERIEALLDKAVRESIDGAIRDLSKDYRVKTAAGVIVAAALERVANDITQGQPDRAWPDRA